MAKSPSSDTKPNTDEEPRVGIDSSADIADSAPEKQGDDVGEGAPDRSKMGPAARAIRYVKVCVVTVAIVFAAMVVSGFCASCANGGSGTSQARVVLDDLEVGQAAEFPDYSLTVEKVEKAGESTTVKVLVRAGETTEFDPERLKGVTEVIDLTPEKPFEVVTVEAGESYETDLTYSTLYMTELEWEDGDCLATWHFEALAPAESPDGDSQDKGGQVDAEQTSDERKQPVDTEEKASGRGTDEQGVDKSGLKEALAVYDTIPYFDIQDMSDVEGQKVLDDPNATQQQVDAATDKLQAVIRKKSHRYVSIADLISNPDDYYQNMSDDRNIYTSGRFVGAAPDLPGAFYIQSGNGSTIQVVYVVGNGLSQVPLEGSSEVVVYGQLTEFPYGLAVDGDDYTDAELVPTINACGLKVDGIPYGSIPPVLD